MVAAVIFNHFLFVVSLQACCVGGLFDFSSRKMSENFCVSGPTFKKVFKPSLKRVVPYQVVALSIWFYHEQQCFGPFKYLMIGIKLTPCENR